MSSRVLARLASVTSRSVRAVRMSSNIPLGDREKAAEKAYFNANDEKLLKQLLGKIKKERTVTDASSAAATRSVELQRLESIVGKYKVSKEDTDALIAWRHSADF